MNALKQIIWIAPLVALLAPLWTVSGASAAPQDLGDLTPAITHKEVQSRLKKYARVEIGYDESVLSEPERHALSLLVQAGNVMDEIFLQQVWSGNVAMRDKLDSAIEASHNDRASVWAKNHDLLEDLRHFFQINFGPWDRLEEDAPFIGTMAKPKGANYYPEDMTKDEFEAHIKKNPRDEEDFRGFFTRIRRVDAGLTAVPYSVEYKDHLERAAMMLHEAADILTRRENEAKFKQDVDYTTLAAFLRSRADALSSNDYFQSDMDWMDVRDNIIDVTFGPYEVYEDALNSYKAAFEAFIAIRHPEDSKKLEGIKGYLPLLESSLPIPDKYKNESRGTESPISVVDLVFAGGDTKAGVQTIAFNLPNDERVREAKGSKKVMLKNITRAKFDKIMVPIAEKLLDQKQMKYVNFDAYFNNVLMHEMAHGLGPGSIRREDGTETTVSLELKELYPPLEECKADITGLFCRRILVGEGFFDEDSERDGYVSFLPGFFRAIRFGATSAHGRANMMAFNFMREQGAIELKKGDRFHVHVDKMPKAVEAMSRELLMIQAKGDYDAAKAFIEKYGQMTEDVDRLLKKLDKIPVDIEPQYMAEKYVRR